MTQSSKEFIKMNWLTVANIVLLIGIIVQQSQWQKSVDKDLELFQNHVRDKEMHMPFEQKIQVFVPRVELEGLLRNMQRTLDRIENNTGKK